MREKKKESSKRKAAPKTFSQITHRKRAKRRQYAALFAKKAGCDFPEKWQ